MAVIQFEHQTYDYSALSTDTKPTAASHGTVAGSTLIEHDTGIMYITHDGTNWVVKDNTSKVRPVTINTTGTDAALATLDPAADYHMLGIRVFVGSALAAAETLTVTLDANAGGAYDVVLFTLDMGTPDIRSVIIPFGGDEDFFVSGDKLVIALSANAGGDTWGCQTIHEVV